jgi:Mg-chelatase subunit ChlD
MPNQITSPLQSLLSQASQKLPSDTGETARFEQRYQAPGQATVILCDVSGSMALPVGAKRKIDILKEALEDSAREEDVICVFDSAPRVVGRGPKHAHVLEPGGQTDMAAGIRLAATYNPARTLVISDGLPDSEQSAIAAADALPGIIDVLYIGPENDSQAIAFMNRLARAGCGRVVVNDISRARSDLLGRQIAGLLGGPRA